MRFGAIFDTHPTLEKTIQQREITRVQRLPSLEGLEQAAPFLVSKNQTKPLSEFLICIGFSKNQNQVPGFLRTKTGTRTRKFFLKVF
jgi:hypothetical protein